jgi:heptosyltransferase-2
MKILIRLPNWIGDAVMATPAIRQIICHNKNESLCVWGPPQTAVLFENYPGIKKIFDIDEKKTPERLVEIKEEKFDWVYLLTNSYSTASTVYKLGIPERIGYRRDWRGRFLTAKIPCGYRVRQLRMVDYYLHLLPAAWREDVSMEPDLYLSREELTTPQNYCQSILNECPKGLVAISPGAAHGSAKCWDISGFQYLARELSAEGYGVIILGLDRDIAAGEEILSGVLPEKCHNLAGRTTLRETMALIKTALLLVTNDSGPMHMADALGTSCVAIFGSTDPDWTGPRRPIHQVLRTTVSCSPCFLKECPINRQCMASITPENALQAAQQILAHFQVSTNKRLPSHDR